MLLMKSRIRRSLNRPQIHDLETNASGKQTAVDSKGSAVDPDGDPEAGPTAPKDFKLSSPTGNGTDIWLALQEAIETTQVASIVLISDGQATGGNDPYNIARDAKKKGIPIYTVGVGDPYKTKNVWIKDIVVPPQAVNPGDPFDVLGIIGFQRIDIKNINVQLVRPGNHRQQLRSRRRADDQGRHASRQNGGRG